MNTRVLVFNVNMKHAYAWRHAQVLVELFANDKEHLI